MIPDAQVEEVRARADLVDIIGELVPLKKSGREFKANCPFHEERTPSFYVVPTKNFYKCFGCGEAGDVFSFVMKRLGMDFVDAVRYVAARSGVEIREVSKGAEVEDPFRAHYEANAFANDFFRRMLLDERIGTDARDYLKSRGIDEATAERFGLGYAPDEWRSLRDAAGKHAMADELLVEVGLLTKSEKSPEPYDRFRHRIMFPIEGLNGHVLAFGGRILGTGARSTGKDPAKYVNTSETPIYHKGEMLYGLPWAKNAIRREGGALVVEGYMDAVSLAAAGFENVVAPLGTSVTDAQAQLLSRYTKRVLLLFDSDEAGLKATFRGGDVLLGHGLHPAVVTLPQGEDPDSLVRREGAAGLRHYLEQAVDVLDRKLQMLQEHDWFSSIEKTRRALDKLLPTVRAAIDPTLRDMYVSRVAERTGVRRETLEAELARQDPRRAPQAAPPPPNPEPRPRPRRPSASWPVVALGPERAVLLVLARDPGLRQQRIESLLEHVGPEDFTDPLWRAIFQALLDDPDLDHAPPELDPEAARRLEALFSDRVELHPERVFGDGLMHLRLVAHDRRMRELDRRMGEAVGDEEKQALAEEKAMVAQEGRDIGPGWSHAARRMAAESRNSSTRRI
ncbi:MAG: DNA primase [Gemmatimonadetes bacterium]|nr:DNA primase [Gemmatimonadota bacterium]